MTAGCGWPAADGLDRSDGVAIAATKAHRYVDEMREIAATQADAGLTPALFEAFARIYAEVATTDLASGDPDTAAAPMAPDAIVRGLSRNGDQVSR